MLREQFPRLRRVRIAKRNAKANALDRLIERTPAAFDALQPRFVQRVYRVGARRAAA